MVVVIGVSMIFIVLGFILRRGKGEWLIAGYNLQSEKEKNQYDKLALFKFTGNLLIFIGIMFILFFLCTTYLNSSYMKISIIIFISLIFIVVFGSLIYLNTGNRFRKKE